MNYSTNYSFLVNIVRSIERANFKPKSEVVRDPLRDFYYGKHTKKIVGWSTEGCRQFWPSTKRDGPRQHFSECWWYWESGNVILSSGSGRIEVLNALNWWWRRKCKFSTFLHISAILTNLMIPNLLEMAKNQFSLSNYMEKMSFHLI